MTLFRIAPAGRLLLRAASRGHIERYFNLLPPARRRQRWLKLNNRYRVACIQKYADDLPGAVVHDELVDYIAASAPTHAIDGWSLLTRAIEAALKGDSYGSIHFAYYAELRAAASLLAAEGIGVFNLKHPVVKPTGITEAMPPGQRWLTPIGQPAHWGNPRDQGTHTIMWLALQHWAGRKAAGQLIDGCITPDGIPLSTWLTAGGHPIPAGPVAKKWLTRWGLDLSILEDDHNSRNLASYRPSELRLPPPVPTEEVLEFVEDLWRLFEPGNPRRFPVLERHLLRRMLRSTAGPMPGQAAIEGIGIPAADAAAWAVFLAQPDDPLPIKLAEQNRPIEDPRCHLQMIARAALLLFLATAASRRLLANAAYTTQTLEFWWQRHGKTRGLWDDATMPADPLDVWADVREDIDALHAWRAVAPAPVSLHAFRAESLPNLVRLADFELIGIWGLLP